MSEATVTTSGIVLSASSDTTVYATTDGLKPATRLVDLCNLMAGLYRVIATINSASHNIDAESTTFF